AMKTLVVSLLTTFAFLTAGVFAAAPPGRRVTTDALGDPLPQGAIARLGTARYRTASYSAALPPDGTLVATLLKGNEPRVILTDAVTGLEKRSIAVGGDHAHLAFTPDGKAVVVAEWT